jgi:hypothetical protein
MGVVRVRIACELCKAWEPFVLCRSALLQAASKKKTGSATSCEHPRANGTHRTVHTRLLTPFAHPRTRQEIVCHASSTAGIGTRQESTHQRTSARLTRRQGTAHSGYPARKKKMPTASIAPTGMSAVAGRRHSAAPDHQLPGLMFSAPEGARPSLRAKWNMPVCVCPALLQHVLLLTVEFNKRETKTERLSRTCFLHEWIP